MRIDRFNGGSLRRYHHPSGAVIVVSESGRVMVIPASADFIAVEIGRRQASELILEARRLDREGRANA